MHRVSTVAVTWSRGTVVALATRSVGKRRELGPLLEAAGLVPRDLDALRLALTPEEESLEVHDSFEGNARAKARWYATRLGLPVLAEDSGLEVEALGGAPGVHSKRWAGHGALEGLVQEAANTAALLVALEDAAAQGRASRRARYRCVAVLAWDGGELLGAGETRGSILATARGSGGFGYDPVFLSDELGITFAEASREAKAAVSHRGRAVRQLLSRVGVDPDARAG